MDVLKDGESTSEGTGMWISTLFATLRLRARTHFAKRLKASHISTESAMEVQADWDPDDLNWDFALIMYLGHLGPSAKFDNSKLEISQKFRTPQFSAIFISTFGPSDSIRDRE